MGKNKLKISLEFDNFDAKKLEVIMKHINGSGCSQSDVIRIFFRIGHATLEKYCRLSSSEFQFPGMDHQSVKDDVVEWVFNQKMKGGKDNGN